MEHFSRMGSLNLPEGSKTNSAAVSPSHFLIVCHEAFLKPVRPQPLYTTAYNSLKCLRLIVQSRHKYETLVFSQQMQ